MKALRNSFWTTEHHLKLGRALAAGFGMGLNADKPTAESDECSTESLITLSNHLSRAFLP